MDSLLLELELVPYCMDSEGGYSATAEHACAGDPTISAYDAR